MSDELKEAYNDEYMFLTTIEMELKDGKEAGMLDHAVNVVITALKDRKEDMFNRGL